MRTSLAGALALLCLAASTTDASAQVTAKRGEYLATIMACADCHTPGLFLGKPDFARTLGGSEVGFMVPGLGIFYPPNLTPDAETGLGRWSEADIVKALRTGIRPDGRELAPSMPWRAYAKATDADIRAVAAYLKSLKPVKNQVPPVTGPNQKPTAPYLSVVMPN